MDGTFSHETEIVFVLGLNWKKCYKKGFKLYSTYTKMQFLDINLTKYSSLFAPCYSQSFLLADFKEKHTFLWFSKSLQKILESIHDQHFEELKNEGGKPDQTRV